jgi:uncharacterized membrane protein HdeD (DUF308 family)
MISTEEKFGLASRWGWVVLRGVIAIIFGLAAFSRPGAITLTLILLFGAYAFVGGVFAIVAAVRRGREGESWGWLLLDGVLGIIAAVCAVMWPAAMALAFVYIIGFWALFSGVMEIGAAIRLRKVIEHEWALGLAGALSVAFGLVMFYRPVAGGLAVVWWLGAYAIAFGVLMIVLGLRLRRIAHPRERRHLPPAGVPQPG